MPCMKRKQMSSTELLNISFSCLFKHRPTGAVMLFVSTPPPPPPLHQDSQVKNKKPCQCHALPSSSPSPCLNVPLVGQKIYLCSSPPLASPCSPPFTGGSQAVYSSVSAVQHLSAPRAFNVLLDQLLISRWLR